MPVLIYYMIEKRSGNIQKIHLLLGLALVFAWLGDVLLMWDNLFLAGLGAFLVMQVLYFFIFRVDFGYWIKDLFTSKIHFLIPFVVFGTVFLYVLLPNVDSAMTIPIVVYAIVIILMVMTASFRKTFIHGFKMTMYGAICFLVSDSLLAYNKFVAAIPFGGAMVIFTYILAQYLIVEGLCQKDGLSVEGDVS